MKKVYFGLLLSALPVFAVAQQPDQLKQLKVENAQLRIQVTNLQSLVIQLQGEKDSRTVAEFHAKAVKDLEDLNPGMKWDEQQGKLVKAENCTHHIGPDGKEDGENCVIGPVKDHGQAK